ncbi:T-box transcription factor TBX6 [Drosophila grimshawi]|uniref:GH16540 n=1 Tax=Drosophila grimshawi TaxID=7222 RepID=B4J160_DROGR|nr:T-box transcription factor TBX6 [Drosophila grimshawi]EDV96915.1 GH16540 [Drosophila grimshawi]
MLALLNIEELRMQQQITNDFYRQQMMQRLPDPLCGLLPHFASHFVAHTPPPPPPPQPSLPGVEAKLENNELWQQFHHIGTEMIITKSGRRMFPSMRVSFTGLEEEANYCVLLEMVPIGDCRYKFSGSQWVPAGGAEPQSPQRMYLHPDSPATGKHWQSQALLFSKVKLTNNTMDNNGHIVLASMHKYQPRLHIIRTADLTQIAWAPQQAYVFPETEFIAVTAYQNDRITKLKIDHNPFAKGFRESGQSRSKRKLDDSPPSAAAGAEVRVEVGAEANDVEIAISPSVKRLRHTEEPALRQQAHSGMLVARHYLLDTLEANFYLPAPPPPRSLSTRHIACYPSWPCSPPSPDSSCASSSSCSASSSSSCESSAEPDTDADAFVDVVGTATGTAEFELESESITHNNAAAAVADSMVDAATIDVASKPKRSSFSILDILGATVSV